MLLLILLGSLFAIPLTWLGMNQWLSNFAYRIDLNPLYFIPAVGIAIVILTVTIGFHLRKVLHQNPASILRAE